MAEEIIHPNQLSSAQTERILNFLNQATSAAEIANGIELAGEPDIGMALAARILRQRELLGGRFSQLQQILDIPYIGPERFNDLVHAIVGSLETTPLPSLAELAEELKSLRQQLINFDQQGLPGQRLTLQVSRSRCFLGQAILIKATLTEVASGKLLVGYPVTFFCSWGQLRTVDQLQRQQGSSVTVPTGTDGLARAMLEPSIAEALTDEHQEILKTELDSWPEAANSPQEQAALEALKNLARKYFISGHFKLRQAIDAYLKQYHPKLSDTIDDHDFLVNWQQQQIAVMAMVQGGDFAAPLASVEGDSSIQVSAVLNLTVVDWLPAWLEVFIRLLDEESGLQQYLGNIKTLEGGKYSLAKTVDYYIDNFAGRLNGLAGEYAGKRVIGKALGDFIQQELPQLSQVSQAGIYSHLQSTSKSLAAGGVAGLQSNRQGRLALEHDFNQTYANKKDIGRLQQSLDSAVAGLATTEQLNSLETDVRGQLQSKASIEALDNLRTSVDERFAKTPSLSQLDALQKQVNDSRKLFVTQTQLDDVRTALETAIANKLDINALATINDSISSLRNEMTLKFNNTVARNDLDASVATLQRAISEKASKTELATLDTNLRSEIASNNTLVRNQLTTEVSQLSTRINTLSASGVGRTR